MQLPIACIKRPVLAWVMTLIVIILGIVSFYKLEIDYYPKFEQPVITIETQLSGSSAEVVESSVTRIIEDALASIDGVDFIRSESLTDTSKVYVTFRPEKKLEDGIAEARDKLFKIKQDLPKEAPQSTITRTAGTQSAVMSLALTAPQYDLGELAEFARNELESDLESIPGVAQVIVQGSGLYIMHIYLDPRKLTTHGISVKEVIDSVARHNFERPAGKLTAGDKEYIVTTFSNLEKPIQFENMAVTEKNGHIIYVRDLGRVEMMPEEKTNRSSFNGKRAITIVVNKQSTANPLSIAKAVNTKLKEMRKKLHSGMELSVAADLTGHIQKSINQVYTTIFEAIVLVTLVVLLFLQSFRAALIPLLTIPISLIGTFTFMYYFGFTINIFSLIAIVLAIGLVVDDAIVVLENIHRYIEKGLSPINASVKGIKEISFAVIAMTLTLASVYLPTTLMQGVTGKIMIEFALTLAIAVMISGFAALTLSPMMCSRILKTHEDEEKELDLSTFVGKWHHYVPLKKWLNNIDEMYAASLEKLINKRLLVLGGSLAFFLVGFFVYSMLPSTKFPDEDRGTIRVIGYTQPSATIDFTENKVFELDKLLAKMPEVEKRSIIIETNSQFKINMTLKDGVSSKKFAKIIENQFNKVVGINAHIDASGDGGDAQSVQYVIRANKEVKELADLANAMDILLSSSGFFSGRPLTSYKDPLEQYGITISAITDALKVDPLLAAETVEALIRGKKAATFKKSNRLYDVFVEVEKEHRQSIDDINKLFVKTSRRNQEIQVPLAEILDISAKSGYPVIHHHNRARSYQHSYKLKQGTSMSAAIHKVQDVAKQVLPEGVFLEFTGDTKDYLTQSYQLLMIFTLALAFIYLVMAAQFESWRDPFIIIISFMFAAAGGILTFSLKTNSVMTLFGNIGLLTLIGLITKHGIMMVDFANKLRDEENIPLTKAILTASKLRLRPILMTTAAMVLGAVPLLFARTTIRDGLHELGVIIIGGLIFGTILTLYVVPCVYTFVAKKDRKKLVIDEEN